MNSMHAQPALAELYNVSDIGVFPTEFEAFGLVFLECLASGTPVIGTAAGGPLEFVNDDVGHLVFDFDSNDKFAVSLGERISQALRENWKESKREAALAVAKRFTLTVQCDRIMAGVDSVLRM